VANQQPQPRGDASNSKAPVAQQVPSDAENGPLSKSLSRTLMRYEAEFVSKDSDQTETAPNGEQAPMVYPGKDPRASDSVLAAAGMRVTARYSGAADDLRLADEMLAQARTKQLPSTRTEIGAGSELIDREKVGSHVVDTVAHPDYVTAEASRDRLALASEAGSLSLALDAADTIQAQDSLEKMLIHQMAVLHCGMMRATA
jgi:hypothetical protein